LWEGRIDEPGVAVHTRSQLDEGYLLAQGREALGTTALEALPDVILKMPGDSYAPFWLAVFATLVFAGLALSAWIFAGAMLAGCAVSVIVWLWPERALIQREPTAVHDAGG
jgi:cytochrome c oxidase subunit 1/cytochrome c oxidase subunit I+III